MDKSIHGSAHLRTVRLGDLRVSGAAQREFSDSWGDYLDQNFNIDMVGTFVVSHRDGVYWIVDGQHRHHGLCAWCKREFGDDWADWTIQVTVHEGLTEREEAALFLAFNKRRNVNAFDRFRVSITAELPIPSDINRVVLSQGLRIERGKKPGAIFAVVALERIYRQGGAVLLRRTLATVRDAWASVGFDSEALLGISLFINRYEGRYNEERLVKRLSALSNGARGLRQRASVLRDSHGSTIVDAHAAAATDIYNQGLRGTASLGSWWKEGKAAA